MNVIKCSALFFSFLIFCFACGRQGTTNIATNTANNAATPAAPTSSTPAKDERSSGADLYTTNCMTCHKDSGKGGKVTVDGKDLDPNDLTTTRMKDRSDEKLYRDVSEGAPDDGMPAFKDKLTPQEIKLVISHLRRLQGGAVPAK